MPCGFFLHKTILLCCSKLDEDTQLALALSVSATDTRDTKHNTVTQPPSASPVKDVTCVLTSSARDPVRAKDKKKMRCVFDTFESTAIWHYANIFNVLYCRKSSFIHFMYVFLSSLQLSKSDRGSLQQKHFQTVKIATIICY